LLNERHTQEEDSMQESNKSALIIGNEPYKSSPFALHFKFIQRRMRSSRDLQ